MNEERQILSLHEPRDLEKPQSHTAGPPYAGFGYAGESEADENHVREYLRAVRKHLWMIAGITLLVTALAAVFMARQPDIFAAQARVQVDLEHNPASGVGKSNTVVISSPTSDPAYFNTQLQNVTSQGLLRRVVKTLDLEHNQSFLTQSRNPRGSSTWQSLRRVVGLGGKDAGQDKSKTDDGLPLTGKVAPATAREDLVEAKRLDPYVKLLHLGLKVDPVKETRTSSHTRDTRLIDIRFTHADPQLAAKIVNAVADTFVLSNLEKKTETTANTGDFLQKRVAELQSQIRTGEERLMNYAKQHQILSLDGSQNTVVERLAGLNSQLLHAESERKEAEAAYRAAQSPGAADALASKDAKSIEEIEGKVAALRERRAQLLVDSTEEWPEVKETTQQIATLEKQAKEMKSRATSALTTNLETRYRQAVARENAIRDNFNKQRGETLSQNESAINYRIIQQEIETNKQLLDGLLQRSKENDVVLADTPNNISVVDYALAPESPVGPRRRQGVTLAFLLSLAFGTALALFLEYLNDTVRSSDDVETLLRLPALSVIPTAGVSGRRLLPGPAGAQLRRGFEERPELLINADTRSPLSEAYRHLRTAVLLSRAGQAPRTLLVTSSLPSEGKTTTSINTAIALAQTGARVVVIDADMRRPCLHRVFGAENERGLSTILSSDLRAEEMLAMVRQHEASSLHLLPSGPVSPNPAELLGSEQMRRLLSALEANYTHVVIDSPPIVSFTDGVLISTMVDGVLLVVHGGKTPRNVVRRSKQILQEVGARILGVVLNNINLQKDDYYYYQHYHTYYGEKPQAAPTQS